MTDKSPPCRARTMLFAPRKEPFLDTKSKCGPNSRPKVPLARINTGEQALFRLPEISAKSPLTQVQKPGFWGCRRKSAETPVSMRVGGTFACASAMHLDWGQKTALLGVRIAL